MSAADVAYVVAWEAQTGITLNMAFNGVGACTAPSVADESNAKCTGSITEGGTTYTLPGQVVDSSYPNDQGLINALLADQKDFNWTTHTWSHEFLGVRPLAAAALHVRRRQDRRHARGRYLRLRDHRRDGVRRI